MCVMFNSCQALSIIEHLSVLIQTISIIISCFVMIRLLDENHQQMRSPHTRMTLRFRLLLGRAQQVLLQMILTEWSISIFLL
jgi:hypothetical protein